jgi:magnesium transporter
MLTVYPSSDRAPDQLDKAVWIDLCRPTEDEIEAVRKATGLRVPSREDISAIEASSRLQREGGALYLSTSLLVML